MPKVDSVEQVFHHSKSWDRQLFRVKPAQCLDQTFELWKCQKTFLGFREHSECIVGAGHVQEHHVFEDAEQVVCSLS